MSVLQNPITGRMRQKLGGVVFTTWKGINVMRGKPLTVANPKTDPQLMRRSALTQITAIARLIVAAISFGYKEQAVRKSAFNAFVGYNLRNAFDYSSPPVATLQLANIVVSQGTIAPQQYTVIGADFGDSEVVVNWDSSTLDPGQSAADVLGFAFYCETADNWLAGITSTPRSANTATIPVPSGFMNVGNTLNLYIFFYNTTSRKSSDSIWDTTVVVA